MNIASAPTSNVWYITGASQGLGLILVKQLLAGGYRVAATSRNAGTLKNAIGLIDKDRFLPLTVDLSNPDCIDESIRQTLNAFGRIDVLVNNAGYGMAGPLEDTEEQQIKNIIDINLTATIEVTKHVLPIMRKQQSGYIINIGSVAGFVGAPGWSVYSATKAAVAAFSEVLALDLKEYNIHVTVVEPSGFRTGFLTKDSLAFIEPKAGDGQTHRYVAIKKAQERYLAMNGLQPGDPEKAAQILIGLSQSPEPPTHLFLGADAYNRASQKLTTLSAELEKWKTTTLSADFPPA